MIITVLKILKKLMLTKEEVVRYITWRMTKKEKLVIAKVALGLNVPAAEIAKILGIHRATVYRYSDKNTPEDLQQFATEIATFLKIKQAKVVAVILRQLEKVACKSDNLKDLTNSFEVLNKGNSKDEELEKSLEGDSTINFLIKRDN